MKTIQLTDEEIEYLILLTNLDLKAYAKWQDESALNRKRTAMQLLAKLTFPEINPANQFPGN